MTPRIKSYKRLIASVSLATMLTAAVAMPALAADTDSTTLEFGIQAGTLDVTISDPTLTNTSLSYSTSTQTVTTDAEGGEAATVTTTDLTGSGDAWVVTATSTGLVNADDVTISGGAIDVTPGEIASHDAATAGPGGTLDQERVIMSAAEDAGDGVHSLDMDIDITVPASQAPGDYSGDIVVTVAEDID